MKNLLDTLEQRQAAIQRAAAAEKIHLPRGRLATQLGKGTWGLTTKGAVLQGVDEKRMAATFVISTEGEDRVGDVMVASGCRSHLKSFEANPRVFFNHQEWPLPIASARDPKGKLALQIEDRQIVSTAYFHGKTKESSQVFALVAAKELETASIGFRPIKGEPMTKDRDANDLTWPGMRFDEWELLEWSVVGVPANGEAIARRLSLGRIGKEQLSPDLVKALQPFAAKSKTVSVTFKEFPMALAEDLKKRLKSEDEEEEKEDSDEEEAESKADEEAEDDESLSRENKEGDEEEEEEKADDAEDSEDAEEPVEEEADWRGEVREFLQSVAETYNLSAEHAAACERCLGKIASAMKESEEDDMAKAYQGKLKRLQREFNQSKAEHAKQIASMEKRFKMLGDRLGKTLHDFAGVIVE